MSRCRLDPDAALRSGYGRVNYGPPRPNGKGRAPMLLHRWVMEQYVGRTLRPDEVVMHTCDRPACFYIDHLRIGTQADNVADMDRKGRRRVAGLKGSANHQAKLTEADARHIRRLNGTAPSRVVGARFGVSGAAIRGIWLGKAWRHV